ncbi:diacylglycerol kinase family lipid kinase [Phenylobacterium sp. LH3H17]|uniref:diacylglycerol/lipid kinase family protein n=1 Tax=Phenylobacterium sp. LH3H17 TaxID=2903901 RepID=UPI0020C9D535|nr:diacylglycerol kinase family protein [Phenylobacterium sp. LH3H17]UTP40023.1 diacylglycerol kinase family lipid kinase [Phenylobacterium sp. LH3H17]
MAGKPKISRVEVVVNVASGSVGPGAPDEIQALLAEWGVRATVSAPAPGELGRCLRDAIDAAPDAVLVLAGDGTARAAAELAGPDGPLIAPLPGGTMNMLPHAVYGVVPWQEALKTILEDGREQAIGGGEIDGRTFLVAAILGSPALWAPAREAVRDGELKLALARAQRAWRRAFSGRLRYALDGGPRGKAEALTFLCPMASKAMSNDEQALEVAAIDPKGLADAARMGIKAIVDDWRNDPAVEVRSCRSAGVWAAGRIPAVLDGEPVRLNATTRVTWRPKVARILAPPKEHGV